MLSSKKLLLKVKIFIINICYLNVVIKSSVLYFIICILLTNLNLLILEQKMKKITKVHLKLFADFESVKSYIFIKMLIIYNLLR